MQLRIQNPPCSIFTNLTKECSFISKFVYYLHKSADDVESKCCSLGKGTALAEIIPNFSYLSIF